ncbi:MAG: Crp/Fnr family transcriptional regulator [Clostridiales bacterium]|nr:Crp/Fnr family transcriptional regulator [Clostridiales bacterium]
MNRHSIPPSKPATIKDWSSYEPLLCSCPLFSHIPSGQIGAMLEDMGYRLQTYEKGEFLFHNGDILKKIGIILSGSIQLILEDYWGNENILGQFCAGDLFGESYAFLYREPIHMNIVAQNHCEILYLSPDAIFHSWQASNGSHQQIIQNLLHLLSYKNIVLNQKIKYLTRRTTREKILAFLSDQADRNPHRSFEIPYSRQQMADFLSVDRSALSRELSKMKAEGILDYDKNRFWLA